MTLVPTRIAETAESYLRPGGAWHGLGSLDELPAGPALLDGSTGRRVTAAEVDADVARLSAGLAAEGVRPSDVVTWRLSNGVSAVLMYRACWRIGAIAAPVHHRAGPAETDAALAQVQPVVSIEDEDDVVRLLTKGSASPIPRGSFRVDPSAVAVVMFTSGSTGRPKAVLHTHQTLGYKARSMVGVHALGAGDVSLMPAPMAHVSGLQNGILVPAAAGMKTVTMAVWDTGVALSLIEAERVSFMVGPPTFFIGIRDDPNFDPARMSSLALVSSGGTGVTPAFVDSTAEEFGCVVKRTYGSTEAPTVTTTYPSDPLSRRRDTDGRATGPVELRIVDSGELWVRGPELCQGYASPDDNDRAFTDDGWFRTGDIGVLDDGWLTIVGRLADTIIRGGENIAAGEVEAVLESHPEIRQAVAVGYPDPRLGERVCAYVVVTPGTSFGVTDARRWFEARGVTRFKWPERVEVLTEMPTLAAGKPDRAALRTLALGATSGGEDLV